jgi:tetratricopeptide (TPR) repeat protein
MRSPTELDDSRISTLTLETDALLSQARAHAAEEAWGMLRDSLVGREAEVSACPELAALLAEAELRLCNPAAARHWLLGALPALMRAPHRADARRAINLLGAAHFALGNLAKAEAAFARALELATTHGDDLLVARAANNLGAVANVRGSHGAALGHYLLAVPVFQRIGSPVMLAESFHNMAITFRDLGQFELADRYESRAMEFAREGGSARLMAMARVGRAELSLLRGDAHLAEAGARLAVVQYEAIEDPEGEANALRLLGVACAACGSAAEALQALDRAVSLAREHGSALIEAESLRARADLLAASGELARARSDVEEALAIYTRLGVQAESARLTEVLKEFASQHQ